MKKKKGSDDESEDENDRFDPEKIENDYYNYIREQMLVNVGKCDYCDSPPLNEDKPFKLHLCGKTNRFVGRLYLATRNSIETLSETSAESSEESSEYESSEYED